MNYRPDMYQDVSDQELRAGFWAVIAGMAFTMMIGVGIGLSIGYFIWTH